MDDNNDLEKYIFDPKDPKKCKVYKLLLNIVKKQDNIVYISPRFFCRIFKNAFKFIKDELWDIPDIFDNLNILEKVQLYIKQYSITELINRIDLSNNIIDKIFCSNLNIGPTLNPGTYDLIIEFKKYKSIKGIAYKYIFDLLDEKNIIEYYTSMRHYNYHYDKNIVFFTDSFGIVKAINPDLSSVVVMMEDNPDSKFFLSNMPKNVHPLLIQDEKDIHLLLDVLYRDMQREESLALPNGSSEDISFLESLSIQNYFTIKDIKIDGLQDKKEIYVLGENGDGKTLFSQALVLALKGNEDVGEISDFIKSEKEDMKLAATDSVEKKYSFDPKEIRKDGYQNIFAYGVNRSRSDSDQKEEFGYLTLFHPDQYLNNPVKWLQYLDHKKASGEEDQISPELAKEMIRDILDENIDDITITPDRVIFRERGTEVRFSQLSDGYKNVIIWVCDLLERLARNQPHVVHLRDFRGIVVVDEIDLHLHPKWKYQIVRKLRSWFPQIQFILTTHSPTVILGSSEDAVFYKIYKQDGKVQITRPLKNVRNLMANTVLTSPLFGLPQSSAFNSKPEEIDTSDDYLVSAIHKAISNRLKNDKSMSEDDILKMVFEELDKFESENGKD